MKNLSEHTDLPCDLLTSLPIRGIKVGEIESVQQIVGGTFCHKDLLIISNHLQTEEEVQFDKS
jgi:hypothetical protein